MINGIRRNTPPTKTENTCISKEIPEQTFSLRRRNLASSTCCFESSKTNLLALGFRIRKADFPIGNLLSSDIKELPRGAYTTLHLIGGASGNDENPGGETRQESTETI
jgi:hypothetical protein